MSPQIIMAVALGGALGAVLARPDAQVVAFMGDGGFLMNAQEIETARRIGVGYTIIVFNDNEYGLISWKQHTHSGKTFGTKITNPDFKKYAEAYGLKGYSPKTLDELENNLEEAICGQELCIVEVPRDPKVNYELTRKLRSEHCRSFKFDE